MSVHHAFVIGKTHEVCQDYAVSGCDGSNPFAIVSDGCSSSPDTDVGARLLVKSAERIMRAANKRKSFFLQEEHEQAARLALKHACLLQLPTQCTDATLLTVNVCDEGFRATCYGDGIIALKSRDGGLDVYSVSFKEGYPHYPSYAAQPERGRIFLSRTNNLKEITRYSFGFDDKCSRVCRYVSHDAVETFAGRVEDYEFIALLTDGFHSFVEVDQSETSKRTETVALETMIGKLLRFKNTGGQFVRRRLNKFLSEAQKKNMHHNDDLGIAVVHLGD